VSIIRKIANHPKDVLGSCRRRFALDRFFRICAAESIRHDSHMGKYVMSYVWKCGRLEVECNRRGEMSEIEFDSL
jgi:hypothetical protein